jgi:hypothetical protein
MTAPAEHRDGPLRRQGRAIRMLPRMHDFDFLHGRWRVINRRLKDRLVGSDDWEEFESVAEIRSLFNGAANIDEIIFPDGTRGLTLRLYDPARKVWSLHWTTNETGVLFPPVVGSFSGGRGVFYGADREGSQPVDVRFVWTPSAPGGPRWEQAFSVDGRQSWETNWFMDLRPLDT